MKFDEEVPQVKYTALSPATWIIIVQLLLVHWKIVYNIPITWLSVFIPLILIGSYLLMAGVTLLGARALIFASSKLNRKF